MSRHRDELLHFFDIDPPSAVSRRRFLALFGSGIVVAVSARDLLALQEEGAPVSLARELPDDFNAFLRIGEDGRVTCFTGKIEMGQGVVTSLAQTLADELEVPLEVVDMAMGDTDLGLWDMGTFGSMTTRFFAPALRAAAAEAREVLLDLAAERLEAPRERLAARQGRVVDTADPGRGIGYAELTKGQAIGRRLGRKAPLQKVSELDVVGRPVRRRDAEVKVTGRAAYAGDIRREGMLYARLVRPPAHGATLRSIDVAGVAAVEGATVIRDADLVAVLHPTPDGAEQALAQVKAQWDTPASTVDQDSIFDHLVKVAPPGETVAEGGSLAAGRAAATASARRTFHDGYRAHAAIETHTALAAWEDGRLTIWASTQTPYPLRAEAAEALGLPEDRVRVVPPFLGGGFGGKSANRQAIEAARLARLTGRPVQVAWTRAEEFFYDTFRPAAVVTIDAGVTPAGRISYWDYLVYFAGDRGADQFYDIPHHRTVSTPGGWRGIPGAHPFATGAWRAPGNNTNTFARESHIDILAAAAGLDPVELRLRNLTDAKMRGVLQAAAERFSWRPVTAPSGRGQGMALGIDAGTYVALAAEVEVDRASGRVRVERLVCAQNMGLCVNPAGATIQMEGCLTMGLGYALAEEVRFAGGEVLDRNFDTYELPRFSWLPAIETVIIDAPDDPPQGGGEPAIIVVGAAIANAVFDAVGARVLRMPLTPARVKAALRST
ncbi:MAG TPA: molybdopterin-dependent oxidoreductase [Thermoanaerobaculales bacterium]|nr:molybdopterin-dependent oxidoreductase [Thermoanaerobaculales bacterium]